MLFLDLEDAIATAPWKATHLPNPARADDGLFPPPPRFFTVLWRRLTLTPIQRLVQAVQTRSLADLQEALGAGADPHQAHFNDGTPVLHGACRLGWMGGIEALLSAAPALALTRLSDDRTVLHFSAPYGLALVIHLIGAGAPLDSEEDIRQIGDELHPSDRQAWQAWALQHRLRHRLPTALTRGRTRL